VARLRYSAAARRDLGQIYHYIRERSGSGDVARRFVQELRSKCRLLADSPIRMGRPRAELRADLRSHPHKSYVIFFRYVGDNEELEIVNVIEGHRDIPALFHEDG
jgi:plasmid stabilization system protein ParE